MAGVWCLPRAKPLGIGTGLGLSMLAKPFLMDLLSARVRALIPL